MRLGAALAFDVEAFAVGAWPLPVRVVALRAGACDPVTFDLAADVFRAAPGCGGRLGDLSAACASFFPFACVVSKAETVPSLFARSVGVVWRARTADVAVPPPTDREIVHVAAAPSRPAGPATTPDARVALTALISSSSAAGGWTISDSTAALQQERETIQERHAAGNTAQSSCRRALSRSLGE